MSRRILVTIRHEIEVDPEWEEQAEEVGFDPNSAREMLEWLEEWKELSYFETDREVYWS